MALPRTKEEIEEVSKKAAAKPAPAKLSAEKKAAGKPKTVKKAVKTNVARSKMPAVVHDVHKIDATDQVVGRLATQVSLLLRGKNRPDFQRHIDSKSSVVVSNASKMKFSGKKLDKKVYYHYSGYPGGLKTKKLRDVFESNPEEVLERAVWNMLPKNKLRDQMIKRLKISK